MSLPLNYRATKLKEKVLRWIAWKLPRSLVQWVYIRVVLHATNGKWGNTIVPNITAMDALQRWDESNEGSPIPGLATVGQQALDSIDAAAPEEPQAEEQQAPKNQPRQRLDRPTNNMQPYKGQYTHTNSKGVTYYLNVKAVSLRGGKMTDIYYFSRDIRPEASGLPKDMEVNENPRNGFLTVRRIDPTSANPVRDADDDEEEDD
jgi:hypothetical protein